MVKAKASKSLTYYLRKYYSFQTKILLCYHPTNESWWADRCFYLDEKYMPAKEYNHRGILTCEVVFEYDFDDKKKNWDLANTICKRLEADGIQYSKWDSGNKSVHVHCLIECGECKNVPLLKKCFIRYYTEGLPVPDLQLAVENHLVRAEFGLHERSGKRKHLLHESSGYPRKGLVKQPIWDMYNSEFKKVVTSRVTRDVNSLTDHPGIKYIITAHQFREAEDGRERALFMLIHLLKSQYKDREELSKYLREWYKYSGGTKLSEDEVDRKVRYHWTKEYTITERYIEEFLESINKSEIVPKKVTQ